MYRLLKEGFFGFFLFLLLLNGLLQLSNANPSPSKPPTRDYAANNTKCLALTTANVSASLDLCTECVSAGCTYCGAGSKHRNQFCYSGNPADLPTKQYGDCRIDNEFYSTKSQSAQDTCSNSPSAALVAAIIIVYIIIPVCLIGSSCGFVCYCLWRSSKSNTVFPGAEVDVNNGFGGAHLPQYNHAPANYVQMAHPQMQMMGGGYAGGGGFLPPQQQGMYVQDPFFQPQQQPHYIQPYGGGEGGGGGGGGFPAPIQTGVILPMQNVNNSQFVASASSSSSTSVAAAAAGGGGGGGEFGGSVGGGDAFLRVNPTNMGSFGHQEENVPQLANVPVVVAKPLPFGSY